MLADRYTRHALYRLSLLAQEASRQAWAQVEDPAAMRRAAGRARQRVLNDLPVYLEQLEARAQAHGAQVHWADGAQEANRLIVQLARRGGAGMALRNHALLLDEIGLDRAAAANNLRLRTLHPGDRIVAMLGTLPSHPVWPAAHVRVEDICTALSTQWRVPETLDPDILASTVRTRLRRSLLQAATAVLGLNFAVAADGALVCLDNDGHNASLLALSSRVICVLSIEQVAADAEDLWLLVRAYARSAWGRALPAYVTQFAGPSRQTSDGADEVHLILVDNGRSRILAEDGIGQALRCIGCGACHNSCPVFAQVGGQGYAPSPHNGPIGAVLNPSLLRPGLAAAQPLLSSGCGACHAACPVDIDLPALLHRQRVQWSAPSASRRQRLAFWLWQRLLPYPRLFLPALRLAHRLRGL